MSLLTISKLSHSYGGDMLFENISLSLDRKDKIGLVGFNGCGKSTLLKILSRELEAFSGEIHIAKEKKISFLKQEIELDKNLSIFETVMLARRDILDLEEKLKKIEKLVAEDHSEKNLKRLAELQHRFEEKDGYSFEAKVRSILKHLSFPEKVWNQKISEFSGGEQTRIQLAKILLEPFDVLLLDEPTNHLDFNMITWLEKYLKNLEEPFIVISHNRSFLDKTIDKTFEIANRKLETYNGNYSFYLKDSLERKKVQQRQYEKQQKYIEKTEDFISRNIGSQKTKLALSRRKQLDKLERVEKVISEKDMKIRINAAHRSGNEVLKTKDLAIGFEGSILAKNIDLFLGYKDKVAIIGKNGCGKSTFLKVINKELNPLSGSFKIGASLQTEIFDQKHINLDENITVLQTIWNLIPSDPIGNVLSYLARFNFKGDFVERKVSSLSGGERSRLYLSKIIFNKPNFLILDEPTNHLDLKTIENLEIALKEYDGTLIFVSHDKYFLERIATKFWVFENSTINETEKSLEEIFNNEIEEKKIKKSKTKKIKDTVKKTNPIVLDKMLKDIEKYEEELKLLEENLQKCYEKLSDSNIYNNETELKNTNELASSLKAKISEKEEEKDNLEMEYLELTC